MLPLEKNWLDTDKFLKEKEKRMRYFLTGATGFVGGRLAQMLLQRGHKVVASVRDPDKAGELRKLGVEVVKGDVTQKKACASL